MTKKKEEEGEEKKEEAMVKAGKEVEETIIETIN